MSTPLDEVISAAPAWRRPGMRVLFTLVRRPRGMSLLRRFAPADQAAAGMVAMARYDDPELARRLGWDADAVAARGRGLRRMERRP